MYICIILLEYILLNAIFIITYADDLMMPASNEICKGVFIARRKQHKLQFYSSWLRHYATSRKVADSSPEEVYFFN
jgi:hypothetical protein